ncbi:acylphosphatase [Microbulbifer salipaludis]|uniref:acylphosphatase n=1 Tax=Microbulbifer salipaludis TaxID=187980 RepID=A0ABS3E9R4_9GAMM|nr:acylphosphatase [Microbulbifer salipaludis]MBN8432024.1 acylphosphatase [Microbulbifer salipaludis]
MHEMTGDQKAATDPTRSPGAAVGEDQGTATTADPGSRSAAQEALPVAAIMQACAENDYSSSPLLHSQDDIGIQLLCNAAVAKGLDVRYHRRLIFEVFNRQRRVIFRQNSPANSAVYTYCARQKHIAKQIMAAEGVPVPSGGVFQDYETALYFFQQAGVPVTVKPANGSSGLGVTSGVADEAEFANAWTFARKESRTVVVEQNIVGQDVRIIVIAGKAEAAYVREPAHVVGDGQHSIRVLVDKKNAVRKKNPSLRLDLIKRFDLLERKGISLDTVPAAGEKVQLASVANTSAGGETVQVFDHLHKDLLTTAERAARCFPGLVQVGVDLIQVAPSVWKAGSPRGYIIEVNSNPGICDAVFPSYGRAIDVPDRLIAQAFSPEGAGLATGHAEPVIALAESYASHHYEQVFSEGEASQVSLIQQAAYAQNVPVEPLSKNVFRLVGPTRQCLFLSGMPEGVRMVSRKVTRNRVWLDDILPASAGYKAANRQSLHRFRLLVIDGKLVSALLIRPGERGESSTRIEVGDLVHASVLPIIDQTLTAIFDPPFVGIDLYAADISRDMGEQPWQVTDAVCNPRLYWHHFPDQGDGRDVAGALVRSALKMEPRVQKVCERFVLRGAVQGVGFRRWLKNKALLHSISGWARNRQQNDVGILEAVLEGTPAAIDSLDALCRQGPDLARVESVERSEQPCTGKTRFNIIG